MVCNIVNWTTVCGDFRLRYLGDNSSVDRFPELLCILGISLVLDLLMFLSDLTGLGILAIVNQDSRILLE